MHYPDKPAIIQDTRQTNKASDKLRIDNGASIAVSKASTQSVAAEDRETSMCQAQLLDFISSRVHPA